MRCMKKLAVIVCAVLMLCGCDTKKVERNSLQLELDRRINSVAQVEQKISGIEANQVNINAEIGALKVALTKDEDAIKENKESLAGYVLSHKLAVSAAAATGAGIAGILADNLNDQVRGAAITLGVMGAMYCMLSDADCSDATAKVSYYGTQIAYYKNDATIQIDKISSLQQRLADLEKYKAPFLADRTALFVGIDALKSQIDALVCRGLLCF